MHRPSSLDKATSKRTKSVKQPGVGMSSSSRDVHHVATTIRGRIARSAPPHCADVVRRGVTRQARGPRAERGLTLRQRVLGLPANPLLNVCRATTSPGGPALAALEVEHRSLSSRFRSSGRGGCWCPGSASSRRRCSQPTAVRCAFEWRTCRGRSRASAFPEGSHSSRRLP